MHARLRQELNGLRSVRGGGLSDVVPSAGARSPAGAPYDVVHVHHMRAALFGLDLAGIPRVYDSVDCISRLFEKTLRLGATPASRFKAFVDLERTRRFEGRVVGRFDRVLTTSEMDKHALAELSGRFEGGSASNAHEAITVVPDGVDLEYFAPRDLPRDPATLVYVGRMGYHANVTAVLYFVEQVLPLIWAQRSDVKLVVVGKDPSREIRSLARRYGPRIAVTGYVPDVRPYLARATVSVSPLVYAVGVQNKILQSMAMATPVVTSRAGAPALRANDGEHVLVADDGAAFSHHVLQLLGEPALQRRIGEGGRRYVEMHHDWKQIVRKLQRIYHHEVTSFQHRLVVSPEAARYGMLNFEC
jgi:glycosyltransferase involved in cell wall biosynthesis